MDGHQVLGFGFMIIGLWHLFNHIKLHVVNNNPKAYTSIASITTTTTTTMWFPTPRFKYLELMFIMSSCSLFIALELFISPSHHQPFDPDGTIPATHLHNFEHSSMSLAFFVYAFFAIALDVAAAKAQHELTLLLAAAAFTQQFLLIHFHSSDHMGPEGRYHLLAQFLVIVSLATTLLGIQWPGSFAVCFSRSVSILFQGVWLMVMGFMLFTPALIPKGCFMNREDGHSVVRCSDDKALQRAISLVNIQFSWFFVGVVVFAMSFYLVLVKWYENNDDDDVESQKKSVQLVRHVFRD